MNNTRTPAMFPASLIRCVAVLPLVTAACMSTTSAQPTHPAAGATRGASTATSSPSAAPATQITPTWTPRATIQPHLLDSYLFDLVSRDPDCLLPCWWGITPGETSWEDARQVFEVIGAEIVSGPGSMPGLVTFNIKYPLPGTDHAGGARILVRDGRVETLFVSAETNPWQLRLHQVLSDYHAPDEVLVKTYASSPDGSLPFLLVLVNRGSQYMALYSLEATATDSFLVACPADIPPSTYVWSRDSQWSDETIQEVVLGPDPSSPLRRLQDVTSMSIPDFVERFREADPATCIETSASNW